MPAIEDFPREFVIDPSLVAAPTYSGVADKVESNYNQLHFNIPRSFFITLERYEGSSVEDSLPPELRFFNSYVDLPPLAEIYERFQQLDIGRFSAERYYDDYAIVYQALNESLPYSQDRQQGEGAYSDAGDPLTDILFEEYVFLQERSGMVSRLKKPINTFIETGIGVVELSKEAFDTFCETRLKDRDQQKKAIAKSIGKWVVISLAGLVGNTIGGLPGAVLTAGATKTVINASFLLVFDP